jgi:polysaccharide pyruvyl transferase WcaK-like protein
MKVGILTFHGVVNYGATLQAYALSQVLTTAGYDVELINYFTDKSANIIRNYLYKSPYFAFNLLKQWKINNFLRTRTKMSDRRCRTSAELKKSTQKFDTIVCGSDEIWNINLSLQDFDFNYFLEFADRDIYKISYGVSFGHTTSLGEYKPRISNLIESFDAISVRDTNSLNIVRDCQSLAVKVLDPTFLCRYADIITPPPSGRKYILVYAHLSPAEQIFVRKMATYYGLSIVAVGYPCRIADVNRLAISPSQWLGYFANATYVVSDFYHGVIFSIIFKKPFSAYVRDSKSNKIVDLLQDLGATDRIVSPVQMSSESQQLESISKCDLMETHLNYAKLEQKIEESRQYLTTALKMAPNMRELTKK